MSVTTDNFEYCNAKISNLLPAHNHSTRFTSNNNYIIHAYNKTVNQNKFCTMLLKYGICYLSLLMIFRNEVKFKSILKSNIRELSLGGD